MVLPTDLRHLVTLSAPTLSPDGRHAVVAARRPNLDEDRYDSALWLVETGGGTPPRRLTHGNDSAPSYSPDGRWVAFLRRDGDSAPQLHVLPTAGGDARPLTDADSLPLGAGAAVWSPDSQRVAFVARVPEQGRYGTTPAEKEPPRRITRLQYREDDVGFTLDRRRHVFVVDIPQDDAPLAAPVQVTDGDADDADVAWSPSGELLAFVSARHGRRDRDLNTDVFVVAPDGSGLRRLTDDSLSLEKPAFTADGATVVALGSDYGPTRGDWVAANVGLFAMPTDDTDRRPDRLTDAETWHLVGPRLVVDGDRVLVGAENRGAIDLVAVPLDGSAPQPLLAGHVQVAGIDLAARTLVATVADPSSAGELAVVRDGSATRLTDFGATLRPSVRPMTEVTATAPDGYPVHGFLVTPEGDGPHPVLLMIHGGPFAQYGWALFDEAQVYARAGYAVVYGNPRGSSGYGQAHGRYILGDVGERSAPDLLALLDAVLDRPDVDSERVGVLGGSHGGFMTTWLVGHTDRFGAAVSERAVNAIDSFTGSSDIGWGFADALYGADVEEQRRQSPMAYVDAITTPLLIVHSEHDWRCPVEQAQRLFVALRRRDAEVEMLLFPGEGHEMSRSGLPSHRVARFDAIVEWFDRFLKPEATHVA